MKFAWLIPVAAGAVWFAFPVSRAEKAPEQAKSVNVAELNQMQVIGWLGQPLGKTVTVEGVVADETFVRWKAQAGRTLLLIQAADGNVLPERVVFCFDRAVREIEEPKAGSRFKYVGYETGGFTGAPPGLFDYTGPYCTTSYGFTTEFVILRDVLQPAKEPESGDKYAPPVPMPADPNGKAPLFPEPAGKHRYTPPAE
jgi:hypothetical protein